MIPLCGVDLRTDILPGREDNHQGDGVMRARNLQLCLVLSLLGWACIASDNLTGSYTLVAIEGRAVPAPITGTQYEVTQGYLQLAEDGTFELSYTTYDSTSVSNSYYAVLSGTYSSENGAAVEFRSSGLTIDRCAVDEPNAPFFGSVEGDSLALTDPNDVRWTFRKVEAQQEDEQTGRGRGTNDLGDRAPSDAARERRCR
jgi:hypothetical protein